MSVLATEVFSKEEWEKLLSVDPTYEDMASSNWQDPSQFSAANFDTSQLNLTPQTSGEKQVEMGRREIQALCWKTYRSFGPINASINYKADCVTGDGLSISSGNLQIDRFLYDFVYSRRNSLYRRFNSWIIRMQGEGELPLLVSFDKEGLATVRVLEPSRIGQSNADQGVICHPDDVTQPLFYSYTYNGSDTEFIPDINLLYDPSLINSAKDISGFHIKKSKRSKSKSSVFNAIGHYRRYVIHWKNFTGIDEYLRDTSSLRTVLEAITQYWRATLWSLDFKKAQSSYTVEIDFQDSPAGRIAWAAWKKMSPEDRAKTGLTQTYTPGMKVWTMPGMTINIKSPQLAKLSGENRDLFDFASAGARMPQDMFQGQSSGATHSSLKMSRPPLIQEVSNMGSKFSDFLRFEVLRACFYARAKLSDFPETFDKKRVKSMNEGVPEFETIQVEPAELVTVVLPDVSILGDGDKEANKRLGSKHGGTLSLGQSETSAARNLGIADLPREKRLQLEHEEEFGKTVRPVDAEVVAERQFAGKGLEGEVKEEVEEE